jgi:hypothetical protein
MRLTKDHFAYIGIYRDAIDQLQMVTHKLWKGLTDNTSS